MSVYNYKRHVILAILVFLQSVNTKLTVKCMFNESLVAHERNAVMK